MKLPEQTLIDFIKEHPEFVREFAREAGKYVDWGDENPLQERLSVLLIQVSYRPK